jgi:dTDP-4-amino-4,6-dideoxygalactose transaminase
VTRPAILGGTPAFPQKLPFARPFLPPLEKVLGRVTGSYDDGQLTNGRVVQEFEELAAERLGVPHAVAVSSCTAGLMLVAQALFTDGDARRRQPADPPPVLVPSFTFTASAHAIVWNGLRPVFAECDPASQQVDVHDVAARLDGAHGIVATHVFGAPCPATELVELGRDRGVPVVFDAAHAFGARLDGRSVASVGDASVFSLSPTKLVVAGEGGLVTTRHAGLADRLRIGRDYGNPPGSYNTRFVGLNARMSEFHAALALESLALLDDHLSARAAIAARYREGLASVPGIEPQQVPPTDTSTYKDFSVLIDPDTFGVPRDVLVEALAADGIDTRNYFDPPVHRQAAYADLATGPLPVTEDVSARITSLPMFAALSRDDVDQVLSSVALIHEHADEIREHSTSQATTGT